MEMERCAGIDWASEEHALCVVNEAGKTLAGELFAHDEAGVRELIARMRALAVARVAIERPDGLLVDRLLEAVARESGKRKVAGFRWACDKRLRDAVSCLANSTRHTHPWARSVYLDARSRGLEHPHAIRVLGRAWLRVLWRCWQDGVPYDPAKHGNLQRLQPAGG